MRSSLHLATVTLGLVLAVYGASSLTDGWIGTPAWGTRVEPPLVSFKDLREEQEWPTCVPFDLWLAGSNGARNGRTTEVRRPVGATRDQGMISAAVITAGVGLVAFGAWLGRRRPAGADGPNPT